MSLEMSPYSFPGLIMLLPVLFLVAVHSLAIAQDAAVLPLDERDILMHFYEQTNGDNWEENTNWGSTEPAKDWFGIDVNEDGKVIEVSLWDNNLTGDLTEVLVNLEKLEVLNLGNNNISGTIPPAFGLLNELRVLNLRANNLEGEIPGQLGELGNLTHLFLDRNDLDGELPDELSKLSLLTDLVIYNNALEGELPAWLGSMTSLETLLFFGNNFKGSIPAEFGNLSNLEVLFLYSNNLTGAIPSELGKLTSLERIQLGNNNLEGEVSADLLALPNLIHFDVRNNQLNGDFPGIPIADNLRNLQIFGNNFTSLPDLSHLNLNHLLVDNNRLDFGHIEPNIGVASINYKYGPQQKIGEEKQVWLPTEGQYEIAYEVGGEHNVYQWYKDGTPLGDANDNTLVLDSISLSDAGTYKLQITNTLATELTLESEAVNIHVFDHPGLLEPQDEADLVSLTPTFTWDEADGAEEYILFISEDEEFRFNHGGTVSGTSYQIDDSLKYSTIYFWTMRSRRDGVASAPAELRSFTTIGQEANEPEAPQLLLPEDGAEDVETDIELTWNADGADTFRVKIATDDQFTEVAYDTLVNASGFQAGDLAEETTYFWRVMVLSGEDGKDSPWSETRTFKTQRTTSLTENGSIPENLSLSQNYPNPFNPVTAIKFGMPEEGHVRLVVYDLLGREAAVLINENRSPGNYEVRFDASNFSSGVYIYRLEAAGNVKTRQMMLVK